MCHGTGVNLKSITPAQAENADVHRSVLGALRDMGFDLARKRLEERK